MVSVRASSRPSLILYLWVISSSATVRPLEATLTKMMLTYDYAAEGEGLTRPLSVKDLENQLIETSVHDTPASAPMVLHVRDRPVSTLADKNTTRSALDMQIRSPLRSNHSPLKRVVSRDSPTLSSSRPLVWQNMSDSIIPSPSHNSSSFKDPTHTIVPETSLLVEDTDTQDVFQSTSSQNFGSLFGATNPLYTLDPPFPSPIHNGSWLKDPAHVTIPKTLPLIEGASNFNPFEGISSENLGSMFGATNPLYAPNPPISSPLHNESWLGSSAHADVSGMLPLVGSGTTLDVFEGTISGSFGALLDPAGTSMVSSGAFWSSGRDGSVAELDRPQIGPSANSVPPYDPLNPPVDCDSSRQTSSTTVDMLSFPLLTTRGDPVKRSDRRLAITPSKRQHDSAVLPPKSAKKWKYVAVYLPGFEPQPVPQPQLQLPPMHVDPMVLTDNEPTWVVDAVNHLYIQSFGQEWKRLLDAWFCRESGEDWGNVGRVGIKNAPKCMIGWTASIKKHWVFQLVQPRLDTSVNALIDQYNEWYRTVQSSRSPLSAVSGLHGALYFLVLLFYVRNHINDDDDNSGEGMEKWLDSVTTLTSEMCAIITARDIANMP